MKRVAETDHEARILSAIEAVDPVTFCDVRKWEFYPIEMPVTSDSRGPATVGKDAVRIEYEVWDRTYTSYGSHDNLPDAINQAMFLNGFADPATIRAEALREAAAVIDRHDSAPCIPNEAWSDDKQNYYVSGQLDAATSWQRAILALIDKEQDQ